MAVGATLIGSSLGLLAGYRGGPVEAVVGRLADLIFALPALLVAVVVIGVLGGGYLLAVAILIFLSIAWQIRVVRGAALVQARLPYVDAARTLDLSDLRIMGRHILPNISAVVVTSFLLDLVAALISFAGLAFLGLGVPAGSAAWGSMLADGQELITTNAWLLARSGSVDRADGREHDAHRRLGLRAPLERARADMSEPQLSDVGTDTRLGPTLSVRRLRVTTGRGDGQRELVREVSFDLSAGETTAIVGESGSGKSMTARSIVGLLPSGVSAHGSVSFAGEPLLGAGPRTLRAIRGARIALLLQDPFAVLNPVQTVREHILESLPTEVRRNRARCPRTGTRPAAGGGAELRPGGHQLSVSALRRDAAAGGPRRRARARSGAADRGRADDRARCQRPGGCARAAREPHAAAGHGAVW